jgi:predicted ATP-dependent endonuclease of OLD family
MHVAKIEITNFRGIKHASILLPKHAVLIGDNNIGKTTIFEAIDLVLGPDRLNKQRAIEELIAHSSPQPTVKENCNVLKFTSVKFEGE